MTDRFRVAHSDINYGMPRQYQRLKEHCVWDTKECLPVGFFEYWGEAMHICSLLNELNNKTHKEKPKPLKQQIIDIIEDVDNDKFDMKNKIIRQKEHIKDLESKIRLLKKENQSLQRNYCKVSVDLQQVTGERDYYYKEYLKKVNVRGLYDWIFCNILY